MKKKAVDGIYCKRDRKQLQTPFSLMSNNFNSKFSFTNNFYDGSIESALNDNSTVAVIHFNGLNQLESFVTKSSNYIRNMYSFLRDILESNKSSSKKHLAIIAKYEKTFVNNDTIPQGWSQSVHNPTIQLFKQKVNNEIKFSKILESEVIYHLKTLQHTIDKNIALDLKKLNMLKDELINTNQTIVKKTEKMKQVAIKLRECELNLQMGSGPGFGENQLHRLIKEKEKQQDACNKLKGEIYICKTEHKCLIKNYRDNWIDITSNLQLEHFNKFHYFLRLINDNLGKGLDDLLSNGLHDLESLKFKLIKYDYNKDLEWASYKFGTKYLELESFSAENNSIVDGGSPAIDQTHYAARFADNFKELPSDSGFSAQAELRKPYLKYAEKMKVPVIEKPIQKLSHFNQQQHDLNSSNDNSSIDLGLNYTTSYIIDKTHLGNNHTLAQLENREPFFYDNKLPLKNDLLQKPNYNNELEVTMNDLSMAPLRQSSMSSGILTNNETIKEGTKLNNCLNSFLTSSNSSNTKSEVARRDQDPIKDMMKSAGSVEGVNWRNRKQMFSQEKEKPTVPAREQDLFFSDKEDESEEAEHSFKNHVESVVDLKPFTKKAENIKTDKSVLSIPSDHQIFVEKPKVHAIDKEIPSDLRQDDDEAGDMTMLTEAVLKMKKKQQKRRSISPLTNNSINSSNVFIEKKKDMKVFIPHHH